MALSPKELQKKKEKQKQKQKQKVLSFHQKFDNMNEDIADFPFGECFITENDENCGLVSIIVSRKLANNKLLVSSFLVDIFCLGVKDSYRNYLNKYEFESLKRKYTEFLPIIHITHAYAKKLIEGAIGYAKELGFEPDKDYDKAKIIFEGVNSDECIDVFEYGYNGKPLYITGENDSESFIQNVLNKLELKCGIDGFEFENDAEDDEDWEVEEEDDEDDFEEDEINQAKALLKLIKFGQNLKKTFKKLVMEDEDKQKVLSKKTFKEMKEGFLDSLLETNFDIMNLDNYAKDDLNKYENQELMKIITTIITEFTYKEFQELDISDFDFEKEFETNKYFHRPENDNNSGKVIKFQ